MKSVCMFCLGLGLAGNALAQGHFSFRNIVPALGVDAPVFDVDCRTRLEGSAFLSQVYAGTSPDQLQPLSIVLPFLTGRGAGYTIGDVNVAVPGTTEGQLVYVQMRAWEAAAGQSFEAAVAAGGKYGSSSILTVRVSLPLHDSPFVVGVQSFCLVPEPSTLVLLGCAAAALAIHVGFGTRTRGLGACVSSRSPKPGHSPFWGSSAPG